MEIKELKSNIAGTTTSIKLSMPDNNPENFTFKMHKFQGELEKGTSGYEELVALELCINQTIDFMNDYHKGFLQEQAKRRISNLIPKNSAVELISQDDMEDGDFNFNKEIFQRTKDLLESDNISISHSTTISIMDPNPSLKLENVRIHVGKWQGQSEEGSEGLYRLMVLKDSIGQAKRSLNIIFEGLDKSVNQTIDQEHEATM